MSKFIELWKTADFNAFNHPRITPLGDQERHLVNTDTIRHVRIDPETSETIVEMIGQGNFAGQTWCVSGSLEQLSFALGSAEVDYQA